MSPATAHRSLMDVHPRELKQFVKELPTLPVVFQELFSRMQDPDAQVSELADVIARDQALTSKILKLVNSAFYGHSQQITTISRAVIIMGFQAVRSAALAVSVFERFKDLRDTSELFSLEDFWRHSIGVSCLAKQLSLVLHRCEPEEAFVAGLLHDVGKLIVDDFLDPAPGKRTVSLAEEEEAVGMNHAEVAEYLLEQWRLPEAIVQSIHNHHLPLSQAGVEPGARVIQMAQALVETWRIGHGEPIDLSPDFEPRQHRRLMEAVGLGESKIPQLVWDVRQHLAGIEKLYGED